ncbi:oxidoreductase domain protein, partial [mine drainage metagenome]
MIRDILNKGKLGEISFIESKWGQLSINRKVAPENKWWHEESKVGGGSVAGMGVHVLDFLNYILGKQSDAVKGMESPLGDIIDNTKCILLRYGNTIATVTSSRKMKEPDNSIRIFGTEGTLEATQIFGTKVSGRLIVNGNLKKEFDGLIDMYEEEVKEFVSLISGQDSRIA